MLKVSACDEKEGRQMKIALEMDWMCQGFLRKEASLRRDLDQH